MKRSPLLLVLLACLSSARAQVIVNEVSASNYADQVDNFGEYEDWIELFNTTGAAVDLSGWFLSDSQTNNTKWAFPGGASIPANGYLVIYCSGRNTTVGAIHHTNFKLNQTEQERAVLSDPTATIVSEYQLLDRTQTDHSRGRTTDAAGTWSVFVDPTPGSANVGAQSEYAPKPVFSVPSGVQGGAVNLSLSVAGAGNTIRYTLDGTVPTAASPAYAAPLAIATTTVVRARTFSSDAAVPPSAVETNTYLIGTTHTVAILSITGDEVPTLLNGTQNNPIGSFEYFGPDGQLRDEATGDFNEHGNDSWAYDQRGIDYVSRDQFGDNDGIHYPIFRTKDRDQYQRLIIKAAASDNYPFEAGGAHIRDAFVNALSQVNDLRLDERSYEPCVMYVNGQYWGVYEIREKVDDADFTEEYYDQPEDQLYFLKTWGGTWQEYGGAPAQAEWDGLVAYINGNDMGDAANFAYVDGLLNWKSLVDYVVLNSQTVCSDWLNWNTAWWRGLNPDGDGRRWRYALWDMDATFGHYVNFTGIPDQTPAADPCNAEQLPDPGGQGHIPILTKMLEENDMVHDYYVNRYIDLNNTTFQCDYMIGFLDSLVAMIEPEMPAHIARWGGSMAEWQGNVQAIRDFITTRCVAITEGLQDCYDITGPYDVVFNVDPPLTGRIQINSITPETYPFSGTYYGGISTTLAAIPEPGQSFSHWEVFSTNNILPTTTDSLVTIDILSADSIVAHFQPPIRYDIVLDVVPPGSASINFHGTTYTDLPTTVSMPENAEAIFYAIPSQFYDFGHWSVANNAYLPDDSTMIALQATFAGPDSIVAHLVPQEYAFYVPNSFTPNADGINDMFQPMGRVIDLESYDLQIFDRWGESIYASKDPTEGWDGSIGGKGVPEGVYVYRAYAIDAIKKDVYEIFGHVTLFR
ncbi:MAG: CotH kinase family protein [Flavobacteriales bacterium]|nr:CotH kinase family protein [Flavobacteriales bacterium]